MARRWTSEEESHYRKELQYLYVDRNLNIIDVGKTLGIAPSTVHDRLQRLQIPTLRNKKEKYNNQRSDVRIPTERSEELAECFGMMLGDGHVSHFQMMVTLGSKEASYARHVQLLITRLFGGKPKIAKVKQKYSTVYLGSTKVVAWLKSEGLVSHKVHSQVAAPQWIYEEHAYMPAFLRGFFDTDGSVYSLRYGIQLSFTNLSEPLLVSLQRMLRIVGYTPSAISAHRVYVTRIPEVERFFREVRPANEKHVRRYSEIKKKRVGIQAVNGCTL
jgi:intein/homing endonuclease